MNWPLASIGHILTVSTTSVDILDHRVYEQLAVQPYPKGVVLKAAKTGLDFPHKRKQRVRAGQFVISRFRAYRGLWGIVPPQFDGAVVSASYLTFDLHPDLNPDYFAAYLSTPALKQAVFLSARKSGRLYLQQFKDILIPMPPPQDQRSIAEAWQFGLATMSH